ncbi:B3 domain-containing protein, partial [Mucuna pruriens]
MPDTRKRKENEGKECKYCFKTHKDLDIGLVRKVDALATQDQIDMGLPVHFCKSNLPKGDEVMTLIDEDGNEYPTIYLARKTGLSGGWKGFAVAHDLADGDALIFQLIKRTTFKVFIVRANSPSEDKQLKDEKLSKQVCNVRKDMYLDERKGSFLQDERICKANATLLAFTIIDMRHVGLVRVKGIVGSIFVFNQSCLYLSLEAVKVLVCGGRNVLGSVFGGLVVWLTYEV